MSKPWSEGPLFSPEGIGFVSQLYVTNPFGPRWGSILRMALYTRSLPADDLAWSLGGVPGSKLDLLMPGLRQGVTAFSLALTAGTSAEPHQIEQYRGVALFVLWEEYAARFQRLIDKNEVAVSFYDTFVERHRFLFGHPCFAAMPEPGHLFALFYQIRRTWYFISIKILGRSMFSEAARQAIWGANLGVERCTYADSLYKGMDEVPVLITGETGTGKDLAAQCVGWSRYIPFDVGARSFVRKYDEDFHVRSLCEVTDNLLASTLFGHKRGSFTGAAGDVTGFFGLPRRNGSLFLDEIGEIPTDFQAKLLRPFQNREYTPVGENHPRPILGRLIFATNRDLEAMVREGKFRADLLERMNGVHIHMPPLRQLLFEDPENMRLFVRAFVAGKIQTPALVETWTEKVLASIHETMPGYAWPRNMRELRNYTERCLFGHGVKEEVPVSSPVEEPPPAAPADMPPSLCLPSSGNLGPKAKAGESTAEDLLVSLVKRVHALNGGNITDTARRTGLDRRTVIKLLKRAKEPSDPEGDPS